MSLGASLCTEAGPIPARLLDLSRSGALAETPRPPAPGTRLILSHERFEAEARVIWVCGARFGLAFGRPIGAAELFFQLGRSREAA